jgi:hypothetical protein
MKPSLDPIPESGQGKPSLPPPNIGKYCEMQWPSPPERARSVTSTTGTIPSSGDSEFGLSRVPDWRLNLSRAVSCASSAEFDNASSAEIGSSSAVPKVEPHHDSRRPLSRSSTPGYTPAPSHEGRNWSPRSTAATVASNFHIGVGGNIGRRNGTLRTVLQIGMIPKLKLSSVFAPNQDATAATATRATIATVCSE